MGYKGHTTIQLFNAKTGALEQETNDDNMVTDAVTKLLNPPYDMMIGGDLSINSCYNKFLPIRTVAMAGIVLLANTKTESLTNNKIDFDDTVVGHAGDVYAGTNVLRGTYNSNESKALGNGYKHVWDFASDRACGDISCVCLTSAAGGNGAIYNSTDKVEAFNECGYLSDTSDSDTYFLGLVAKNLYCGIKWTDRNSVTLVYSQKFNSDAVSLLDTAGTWGRIVSTKIIQHNLDDSFANGSYYVDNTGILRCASGQKVLEINIITGELITAETVSLTMPDEYYPLSSYGNINCVMKNNYIVCARQRNPSSSSYPYAKLLFTKSGVFVNRIGNTNWGGSVYETQYDPYYDAVIYSAAVWVNQNGDIAKHYVANDYQRNVYCYKDIFPYYMVRYQYTSNYFSYSYLYFLNSYLASINNLATMVTKTNQQTMKVTYTITET